MILLLFLGFLFQGATTKSPCSDEGCVGPYLIDIPEPPKIDVSWDTEDIWVSKSQAQTSVSIGYRSYYTAYCYEGGSVDPNTKCFDKHVKTPPNKEEIKVWALKKQCQVGIVSCPGSNYWGSDANLCSNNPATSWVQKAEYICNNREWKIFAHHTCIYDWRCGIESSLMKVYLKHDGSKSVPVTYDQKGSEIVIEEGGTFYQVDPETSAFINSPTVSEERVFPMSCVHTPGKHNLCQVPLDNFFDSIGGSVIELNDTSLWGSSKNFLFRSMGNRSLGHHPVDNGKNQGKDSWIDDKMDVSSTLLAAASVEDLKPVIHSVMFVNAELNYNLLQVLKSIQEVQRVLAEVIKSNGKIDDELIGNILGTHGKAKWFNKDLFHVCPCFQITHSAFSNCGEGYIYKEGRLSKQDNNSKCSSYSPNSVNDIGIFKTYNYLFTTLSFPPADGISANWEGWSWLQDRKQSLIDSMNFQNSTDSGFGGLGYFAKQTFGSVSNWFAFVKTSSFVSYVSLIISLLALFRSRR